jgi:uncharacterized membrane protein YhaH (DUF805 family)
MKWYLEPLKRALDWKGRATRKEYWLFYVMGLASAYILLVPVFVMAVSAGATFSAAGFNPEGPVILAILGWFAYYLAIVLAHIALSVRRLHDTDKSAWHLLLFFIPLAGFVLWLVFMCTEGTRGDNRYGPNPQPSPKASQPASSQDLTPPPPSSESIGGSEQSRSTETTTSVTAEDSQVAELREKLAAAEAAAATKTAADRLQERRTQLIERIHGLEEEVTGAENKLSELMNSGDSS